MTSKLIRKEKKRNFSQKLPYLPIIEEEGMSFVFEQHRQPLIFSIPLRDQEQKRVQIYSPWLPLEALHLVQPPSSPSAVGFSSYVGLY